MLHDRIVVDDDAAPRAHLARLAEGLEQSEPELLATDSPLSPPFPAMVKRTRVTPLSPTRGFPTREMRRMIWPG